MLNNYVRYRNWWYEWQAPVDLHHEAFKEHINSMSLYELMETLEKFDTDYEYVAEAQGSYGYSEGVGMGYIKK